MPQIAIPAKPIEEFCRKHAIRRLSLFGSALREDFSADSDIDVLVEYEPGRVPGLAFFSQQEELSRILGRQVDLNTLEDLSPALRERVMKESEPYYVAA